MARKRRRKRKLKPLMPKLKTMTTFFVFKLAFKSIWSRKLRSVITIGGVVLGIAAIVFLVSLGYGLQDLVTRQVTGIDALRIINVTSEKSAVLTINDEALNNFSKLPTVEEVVPMISTATKLEIGTSIIDGVVYGANNDYLDIAGVMPAYGTELMNEAGGGEAIINTTALSSLGVEDFESALGTEISLDVIITKNLMPTLEEKVINEDQVFTIVGIIEDEQSPYVYVSLSALQAQGITNYSQAEVKLTGPEKMDEVRKAIENMGFQTHSTGDTVQQISQIFAVFRVVVGGIGVIAMVVAALGMFNTLTVSLLERTREIGIMKALGAKTYDVRRIFLTEAMLIAVFGGAFGIAFGQAVAELINYILNSMAASRGLPPVDIFATPWLLVGGVVGVVVLVGFMTGIYPAQRASKLNPLEALRYE